jgi:(R,R)-butanediol dehydrogenase / meso-butanediol dehydrogenase / diacetyl reductase
MTSMKSIVMQNGRLRLEEIAMPVPGPGQVLVRSRACGICGSDLHLTRHTDEILGVYAALGIVGEDATGDPRIMLGHEFSAEIVSYGPDTEQRLPVGSRVTSVPFLLSEGVELGVGVTPAVHGAYSEYFLLQEALLLPIPDNVPDEAAAMAEPLAVGLHAVNRAAVAKDEVALVAGCGPIGLACIVALRMQGVQTIIASDPRADKLALALQFGATHTVNPSTDDEMQMCATLGGDQRSVIFECVGVATLVPDFLQRAPQKSCIVFTGIHTADITFNIAFATVKELDVKFSYYYQPGEFADALQSLADSEVDWKAMCTGRVGIDGVPDAFDVLLKPNDHIKVIIEPWRSGGLETL